jgi:hypothetical protein
MRTIDVAKRSRSINQLLAAAQRENLILRSATGAEFILVEINDFDHEIELQRRNPELMEFLERRGQQPATKSASEARQRLRLSKG